MTTHISARVAWHDNGWNGRICENPAANTYCVGAHSYPGDLIATKRNLEWERTCAGCAVDKLDQIPPCCFSVNAFGPSKAYAESDPPEWFNDGTKIRRWELPPATVCVWPYEAMYGDDVTRGERIDYVQRLENARNFFGAISPDRSLVFYYANYSNPFSEDDAKRYVLVGISRIRALGEELFYDGCSDKVKEKYVGFVWQRAVTSHYPDQGFRIPYHRYRDRPELAKRIAVIPENPRLCKYGTRHVSDDDALGLVEAFLRSVHELQAIGDTTEDWSVRAHWLEELISELWRHRGLLPGMPSVLSTVSLQAAIPVFKEQALLGRERGFADAVFQYLEGTRETLPGLDVAEQDAKAARRQWKLRQDKERLLLREILPSFAISSEQIKKILGGDRAKMGIAATLEQLSANPYMIAEQYHGDGPDDLLPWSTVDRGMLPSPELGGTAAAQPDDERRFRGLLVDALRREDGHVFSPAAAVIESVNRRLSVLPEWKRFSFHDRYLDADKDFIRQAVEIRTETGGIYLYLRDVFEDERLVAEKLGFLIGGPNIVLKSPVTTAIWDGYLFDASSELARRAHDKYRAAIDKQIGACERVFVRPISVLAGEAGTGKTTVIRALIKAIKRGHGIGSSVIALAPTGKAADRIREVVEKDEGLCGRVEVATIHSFLAKHGWLNPNMTFKRTGGRVEEGYATYILDESSMLDLALTATFFRSVRWATVQRLILVGDPNQLPPIGRGRIFADVIEHLRTAAPESIATLEDNLRQLEGRLAGDATGIIDLAQCYLHVRAEGPKDEDASSAAEQMLQRVQLGGDVAPDLRVLYWQDQAELARVLFEQMASDFAADLAGRGDDVPDGLMERWRAAHENNKNPAYFQVLSPYRGEYFGVDELNRICQEHIRGRRPGGADALNGVMLFDKVVQVRNRPQSDPIWAWNHDKRVPEPLEVFNGQLGFVWPHLFDNSKWKSPHFRLEKFRVSFDRREGYSVGYGKGLGKDANNRWIQEEKVEENLELAYTISVHKAQGSEFERVFVVIPKSKLTLLTTEMFYTALTRARRHCTLLIEQDISPLLGMRRPEASRLSRINSSLFQFRVVPDAMLSIQGWYQDGRIHKTLSEVAVRSKSEVIIANMLHERDVPFRYEQPLYAPDGTFYLPDFTVTWRGEDFFWEHVGMLHRDDHRAHWDKKRVWYDRWFPGKLLTTEESAELSLQANTLILNHFV